MKKLISLSNIKSLHDKGQTEIYIDEQTIITPAAKDYAKFNGMVFVEKKGDCRMMNDFDISGLSKEDLYKILKVLVDKGLLDTDTKKYEAATMSNGFKVVRGNTIKMEPLFEETGDKAKYLEVIHSEDSPMQSGYFTIDNTSFTTTTELFETYCIEEGVLDIKVDGNKFRANKGDILSIPKGSKIECSSEGFVKIFYTVGK